MCQGAGVVTTTLLVKTIVCVGVPRPARLTAVRTVAIPRTFVKVTFLHHACPAEALTAAAGPALNRAVDAHDHSPFLLFVGFGVATAALAAVADEKRFARSRRRSAVVRAALRSQLLTAMPWKLATAFVRTLVHLVVLRRPETTPLGGLPSALAEVVRGVVL